MSGNDAGDLFVAYLKIFAFFALAFCYLSLIVRKQIFNYVLGAYCGLYLALLCSGMIHNEVYEVMVFFARHALPAMGLMLLTEIGIYYDPRRLIETGAGTLSFLCILNAVLMLVYPEGVGYVPIYGRVNFLETDNGMTCYYFAAFCFIGLRRILYRKRFLWVDLAFLVSFIYSQFHVFCGLGILSFVMLSGVLLYVFYRRGAFTDSGKHTNVSFWMIYVVIMIGQLWIILGNFWTSFLTNLAEQIFGKGESFQVRRMIWQGALEQIAESPLLGKGPAAIALIYKIEWYSHNGFLDVALKSGLIGLTFCIVSHCLAIAKLKKAADRMLAVFVYGCLLVLFMIAFLEGPFLQGKYIFMFVIAYRIAYLNDKSCQNNSAWKDPLVEKMTARLMRREDKEQA